MPNSATLVQALGAAFCAILCAYHLSSLGGGGMMIGARTAAWAKSGGGMPSPDDYVQNGLVAMWDDADRLADTWTDRVGGVILAKGGTNGNPYGYYWGLTTQGIADALGGALTIETATTFSRGDNCFSFAYFDSLGREAIQKAASNRLWFESAGHRDWRYYNFKEEDWANPTKHAAYTRTAEGDIQAYFNGVEYGELGVLQGIERTAGSAFSLCGRYGGGGYGKSEAIGRVWCCRIYNRPLEATEIAANYAIDKARFNLT